VVLSSPSGATLGRSTAEGRILNDDHAARDLDGDGQSDIVWRHTGGALYVWQMNGTALEASSYLLPISLAWTIQGWGLRRGREERRAVAGDDVGATYVWFMNGAATIGAGYTASQTDNTWTIQGVGDFDGDGMSDILWRQRGERCTCGRWTDGDEEVELPAPDLAGVADPGTGDFDGDGKTDILWRETASGATYVWFMDGASTIAAGYTASQTDNTWSVQGVGDFDADGMSDILWRHTGERCTCGSWTGRRRRWRATCLRSAWRGRSSSWGTSTGTGRRTSCGARARPEHVRVADGRGGDGRGRLHGVPADNTWVIQAR